MKYTQIPSTAFKNIQLNAGILVDAFTPSTGVIGNLLGATSGGVNFTDTVEYKDFGEDIDNCPKNMLELKKLDKHEVKMTGTFVTINAATAKWLAGAADVDGLDSTHIIPRNDVLTSDFKDIWWIGDYSDDNTGDNAGFVAIHMMNALNTGGFQIQTTDKEKGKFAFEFMGHYSMEAQDTVPYEIFVRQGGVATVGVEAEAGTTTVLGELVSDLQSNVAVGADAITGTLKYVEGYTEFSSDPELQDGNFLALKFTADDWSKFTSVKVGLEPSMGSGLVEIKNDPDKNGVFRVANTNQKFKVVATDGADTTTKVYSLAGLVLATE